MPEEPVDMAAVGRVSRRVDVRAIRLSELVATCGSGWDPKLKLQAVFEHRCVPVRVEKGLIEVECSYDFKVKTDDEDIAKAQAKYHIQYVLSGEDLPEDGDIQQFARANGAFHSWPFVRELVFGLTARMGFPPYTLPVLIIGAPKKTLAPQDATTGGATEQTAKLGTDQP